MPKRVLDSKLHDLLVYNPATGKFYWRVTLRHASVRVGDEAGSVYSNGYRYIQINNEDYRAGRLAWFFVTGEDPQDFIDHENRDRDDNSFGNLRLATNSQNQANAFWRTNTSGIKGIRYQADRRKWIAMITVEGKQRNLGRFTKKLDAAMAYRRAAIEAWGEFAKVPSEEELHELCEGE